MAWPAAGAGREPGQLRFYNNDVAYRNMMTKFAYGNAITPGVYYDEENRRHLNTLRAAHAQLALSLIDAGKKDSARKCWSISIRTSWSRISPMA
jgi:hypothetical protein